MKDFSHKMIHEPLKSEDSEDDTNSSCSPVFQFSPEFHRVPSPIFQPEHTFISAQSREETMSIMKPPPILSLGVGTVHSTSHPAEAPIILNPLPLAKPKEVSPTEHTPPSRFNTVSARAKFFEMEIQQQQQPVAKSGKGKIQQMYVYWQELYLGRFNRYENL